MEELMVDVVTFVDDEGAEFEMEIIKEFEHKDKTYVLLAEYVEPCKCEEENCDCQDDDEESLYIFEVIEAQDGEIGEEYVAIEDDDLLEELSAVVEQMLFDEEEAQV